METSADNACYWPLADVAAGWRFLLLLTKAEVTATGQRGAGSSARPVGVRRAEELEGGKFSIGKRPQGTVPNLDLPFDGFDYAIGERGALCFTRAR